MMSALPATTVTRSSSVAGTVDSPLLIAVIAEFLLGLGHLFSKLYPLASYLKREVSRDHSCHTVVSYLLSHSD